MPYYKVTIVHYCRYPRELGGFLQNIPDHDFVKVERRETWRH